MGETMYQCHKCQWLGKIGEMEHLTIKLPGGKLSANWQCIDEQECIRRMQMNHPKPVDGIVVYRHNPKTGRTQIGEGYL